MESKYKRIVIKVGTNVLTKSDGHLNFGIMQNLVSQIAEIRKKGIEVVLVTSGAMGAGRSVLTPQFALDEVSKRQILASAGQVKLISKYNELLQEYGLASAQILATKEDFRDEIHYKNMKSCLESLIAENLIPIINENDVVAVSELMFTDNDELASLISKMSEADALFILTNVDGIFTGNPTNKDSKLIIELNPNSDDISEYIQEEKSEFGRGGMRNKAEMAYQTARNGITVHIANGLKEDTVLEILDGKKLGTKIIQVGNNSQKFKIGLVGYGNMGSVIFDALIKAFDKNNITVCDHDLEKLKNCDAGFVSDDVNEVIKKSEVVIIAVKPQSFEEFVKNIKVDMSEKILLSIMAGISIAKIKTLTGVKKVVRCMPNMGMRYNQGVTGWYANGLNDIDNKKTQLLLNSWGFNIQLEQEDQINKITALSGSGPAYFLRFARLLEEKSQKLGFNKEIAQHIVKNTFVGSASMLSESELTIDAIVKLIASKGGTTEAALNSFEQNGLSKTVSNAVDSAYKRAVELNS